MRWLQPFGSEIRLNWWSSLCCSQREIALFGQFCCSFSFASCTTVDFIELLAWCSQSDVLEYSELSLHSRWRLFLFCCCECSGWLIRAAVVPSTRAYMMLHGVESRHGGSMFFGYIVQFA